MKNYDPMGDILAELDALEEVDSKKAAFIIAEEKFQENVRADIDWLLKVKGVSRKALAEELGVSAAAVSKMLGKPNLTLKTIARIFKAVGEECELSSPTLKDLKVKASFKHWFPLTARDEGEMRSVSESKPGCGKTVVPAFHLNLDSEKREGSAWKVKTTNDNVRLAELAEAIVNG